MVDGRTIEDVSECTCQGPDDGDGGKPVDSSAEPVVDAEYCAVE